MTYPEIGQTGQRASGWVGWVLFAACILIVSGMFSILEGLAGIFRDEAFFAGGQVLVFDYTAWGWIHLIIGLGLVAVGIGLYLGNEYARIAGVFLLMLNLVAQFTWIGAYPWWSVIAITLDVLILYALIVHGAELDTDTDT
ncbi:MAG: hypothetical protein ABW122_05580 [Ilumatobacteraceae bacterium]